MIIWDLWEIHYLSNVCIHLLCFSHILLTSKMYRFQNINNASCSAYKGARKETKFESLQLLLLWHIFDVEVEFSWWIAG